MSKIKSVIDKYFDFMNELGGNSFITDLIPEQMLNKAKESTFEDVSHWNAIESTVTNKEIEALEHYFNHKLPKSYGSFLKHRHFIELQLGTYSINFFKNLPATLVEDVKEEIENYYQNLIVRNYLPFAALSDYGVLCFDANKAKPNHEYPVVSFDHEDEYEAAEDFAINFESMFNEFEAHLDEWIKNKRQ